jgi:hypothetical protein
VAFDPASEKEKLLASVAGPAPLLPPYYVDDGDQPTYRYSLYLLSRPTDPARPLYHSL